MHIAVANLDIDFDRWEAIQNGQPVKLTKNQFLLLKCLCENADRVCTRAMLKQAIGWNPAAYTRVVDQHLMKMRKIIGSNVIEKVNGVGYRLVKDRQVLRAGA